MDHHKARIDYLIPHMWFSDSLTNKQREEYREEIVQKLIDHPELISYLIDRYVTNSRDEWEIGRASSILAYVGHRYQYDPRPLIPLLFRHDVSIHEKRQVLFNITQMADTLDESVLITLLDQIPQELKINATCKIIDALSSIRDRAKARQLTRFCLKATDTSDLEVMFSLLSNFVLRTEGNEDVFGSLLGETLLDHESLILAVSLMRESLPTVSPMRSLADRLAERSKLADDYYNLYVGEYVAGKNAKPSVFQRIMRMLIPE